ncbi:transmembrane protein 6/97 [Copromyces sp. CBS 386.78]|nr:transmembrane protein 6/97 [Copromyces sp. CBS 386.78]
MAVYNESRLNYVWTAWFALSIPIILFIDALPSYPSSLYLPPSSPLHPFHLIRQDYIATYNDPIVQWSPSTSVPGSHDSWIGLFLYLEFGFSLPVVAYGFFKLAVKGKGTTGADELLFLVYALETALTTLVCIHDVGYWDPEVHSVEVRRRMVLQFFGPWFLVPSVMAVDMARRILGRIKVADEAMERRKVQ